MALIGTDRAPALPVALSPCPLLRFRSVPKEVACRVFRDSKDHTLSTVLVDEAGLWPAWESMARSTQRVALGWYG